MGTNNLNITYVVQSQSQKEVTMNAALDKIDALLNTSAIDRGLDTPPVSPSNGDLYILGSSPTGAWSGHAGDVAYRVNGAWYFLDPKEGLTIWVADENIPYTFDGSNWIPTVGFTVFVSGGSKQIILNKTADTDTSSVVFQTGFSGRAEFGTIGSDDFGLKVSPDGMSFLQAFTIDKDTADTKFFKFVGFGSAQLVTIASGVVTAPGSFIRVETQSGAGTDDLDTINGGSEGDQLIVVAENDAHTVVVKNATGNIFLKGGDATLDTVNKSVKLIKRGANWID